MNKVCIVLGWLVSFGFLQAADGGGLKNTETVDDLEFRGWLFNSQSQSQSGAGVMEAVADSATANMTTDHDAYNFESVRRNDSLALVVAASKHKRSLCIGEHLSKLIPGMILVAVKGLWWKRNDLFLALEGTHQNGAAGAVARQGTMQLSFSEESFEEDGLPKIDAGIVEMHNNMSMQQSVSNGTYIAAIGTEREAGSVVVTREMSVLSMHAEAGAGAGAGASVYAEATRDRGAEVGYAALLNGAAAAALGVDPMDVDPTE